MTANNVANANADGYVRKVLSQEAVFVGSRGAGVQASEISRITDQFLLAEVRCQASVVGRSDILGRYQDLLQDAFGAPGDGSDLAARVSELGAALEAFANDPESATLALQVIQMAGDLSATFGQLAKQVQVLHGQADQDIGRTVAEINAELQAIHDLNAEIERLSHLGQVGPELLDRRDALIGSLAEKIDVSTFVQEDDRIALYTAGGETLLDALPRVLAYRPSATVAHGTTFERIAIFSEDQIDPATGQPLDPSAGIELVSRGLRASLTPELQNDATPDADQLITSRLRGGALQGLLEARDLILPELDDQLQELADNLLFALNAAHNDGNAWPPPAELSGTRTDLTAFAGATRSGSDHCGDRPPSDRPAVSAPRVRGRRRRPEPDRVRRLCELRVRPSRSLSRRRHCARYLPLQRHHDHLRGLVDGRPRSDARRRAPCRAGRHQPAERSRFSRRHRRTAADYVTTARLLAEQRQLLVAMRANLRAEVARSPLCDAAGHARALEEAYRAVWQIWCEAAA